MSHEGTKSLRRRFVESFTGEFPWMRILSGKILDIGAGDDPLPLPNVTSFDQSSGDVQGDGNKISDYFEPDSFDVCHLSQCLEHLISPADVITQCLKITKPLGFVVVTIPDWVAYEGMHWPSISNGDHKHSFSMIYKGSIAPSHIYIPDFLKQFNAVADTLLARYVEKNYDWSIGVTKDQTWLEEDGVECWNEFVLQKLPRI